MCWGYRWGLLLKSHSQFSNGYILSLGQPCWCYSVSLWFVYVLIMTWSGILHFFRKDPRGYLPDRKRKRHSKSLFFLFQGENLKKTKKKNLGEVKNTCAQTVVSVAHTEHTPPLVKAHMQRPTNTYCTLSHTQTKQSETHTAPGVQLPLFLFCFTPGDRRTEGNTLLWMSQSTSLH